MGGRKDKPEPFKGSLLGKKHWSDSVGNVQIIGLLAGQVSLGLLEM